MLPKGSVIGSWDSGVIGYFSRFPVVNMDGLVNSYDYMQAVKPKWGSGEQFGITHFGITHFANVVYANSAVANRHKNTTLFEGFRYFDDWLGKQRKFQLWPSMPLEALSGKFDKDARFWEQMAPHWDYESESVSVIVDGNMAQAFFKDYTLAKTRDEPLVFSWFTEKGKQFRVWRPWESIGENDGPGILSSFFELPNDVARLVRITTAPIGSVHQGNRSYFGEQTLARFGGGLDGWLTEGEAIANHSGHERYEGRQPIAGNVGGFLTSHHSDKGDKAAGRAISPEFTAEPGRYLTFLIAGGSGDGVGLRLLADGDEVRVWRGENIERFKRLVHPLDEVAGRSLHPELFDDETAGWGHIMLDPAGLVRHGADAPRTGTTNRAIAVRNRSRARYRLSTNL